jgi:hypothetical protein
MYFDSCLEWHERLSEDDNELVLTLADMSALRRRLSLQALDRVYDPVPRLGAG